MRRVAISALGPLAVRIDGDPVPLGGRMQRAVLADLVAHHPGPVRVDALVEHLWGDEAPPAAQSSLFAYLSRLRKLLGTDAIVRDGPLYRLDVEPATIDVRRFEASIAAADFEAALSLWRGEPYGELGTEPFLVAERARLVELHAAALEARFVERASGGDVDPRLVADIEAAVADHPLRERLWATLMRALYRDGRQADALRAYGRAARTLGDELGIAPGPELRELESMILLQHPGLDDRVRGEDRREAADVPTNLRSPTTSFVGRDEAVRAVVAACRTHRTTTLVGPGGVGKTRMAVEVAWSLLAEYPGGVYDVDLLAASDAGDFIERLADAIGVAEGPGRDRSRQVGRRLDREPSLVLVDNCEHLLPDIAGEIDWLVAHTSHVVVLATSREPVGVTGERVIAVPPLRGDEAIAGVQLFAERVRVARPGAGLPSADAVRRVVDALDGLPLAIEIAAAHAALVPVAELMGRLSADASALARAADDRRHVTLTALIDWSYDLLDPIERARFLELSVFAGPFTLVGAAGVWGGDVDDATVTVRQLIRKSLVEEAGAPARFGLLDTIRSYGRDRLRLEGRWDDIAARHLAWVRRVVADAAAAYHTPREGDALAVLRRQRLEIDQAVRSGQPEAVAALVDDVWYGLFLDGRFASALAAIDALADPGPRMRAARTLVAAEQGLEPAAQVVAAARTVVRDADGMPDDDRAVVLLLAGDALTALGEYEEAEAPLLEAERLFGESDVEWGVGWSVLRQVRVAGLGRGDDDTARVLLSRARRHLELAGDARILAYAEIIDASIARLHGRWTDVLELGRKAAATFRALEAPQRELEAVYFVAVALLQLGRPDDCRGAIVEMRSIADRLGDDQPLEMIDLVAAQYEARFGDVEVAIGMLTDQIEAARRSGEHTAVGRIELEFARAHHLAGRPEEASDAILRARSALTSAQQPWMAAELEAIAAEVALALDDGDEARRLIEIAIDANGSLGQLHVLARAHETMAEFARRTGDPTTAIEYLARATATRDLAGAPADARERATHQQLSTWARRELGEAEFSTIWRRATAVEGEKRTVRGPHAASIP
jgi:DNA-binding SARP family transcriptional activator/predicted ATPase